MSPRFQKYTKPKRPALHCAEALNRRHFLKLAALGAAGAGLAPYVNAAKVKPHPCDVIVIGAGMGGISAASRLKAEAPGLKIIVLEARARIGGRVNAAFTPGDHKPLELGASWIHNADFNPLLPLAQGFGLTTVPTPYTDNSFRQDGTRFDLAQTAETVALFSGVANGILDLSAQRQAAHLPDISLQAGLDTVMSDHSPPYSAEELRKIYAMQSLTMGLGEGREPSEVSLYSFGQDWNILGVRDDLVLPSYATLIQLIGAGLDVRLNHAVSAVAYDSNKVTVTTSNGVFTAAQCVIALPTAVLNSGSIAFDPVLPTEKTTALSHIGRAYAGKMYLGFDTTFWDTDATFIIRVPTSLTASEWVPWVNVGRYLNNNFLLAFNCGDFALTVDGMCDADAVDSAMVSLKNLYGNSIPDPVHYARSRWISDPFALAAWPFLKIGGSPDDYDSAKAAVGHVLYFCGDGTSRDNPRSVNGAYSTGQDAANAILDYRGLGGDV